MESSASKKYELSKRLEEAYLGDQVYIKDAVDTHSHLTKIVEINKDTIRVAHNDLIFNKKNLQCVTRGYNYYFVNDMIVMLFPRLYNIISKDFSEYAKRDKYIHFQYSYKIHNITNYVDIKLYKKSQNFPEACAFVVVANDILLCSADIFAIEDYKVLKKCILSRFTKSVKPKL